jgi:hypothetical protein
MAPLAVLALVTACGAAPARPSLAGAGPECEPSGAILYREVHQELDATTGQLGAATTLTVWTSGAWHHDLGGTAGCVDHATRARIRDQLVAPTLEPPGQPTCAGLPGEQVTVEVADLGRIEYQQPCGRGPDDATRRAIDAVHTALFGRRSQ